jgi:branched-chain amino acid transport system substrate-binding protein
MNKKLALAGLLILGLIAGIWWANTQTGTTQKTRVALNLPLSGPIAVFMDPIPNALRMGIEDECKALGIPADIFAIDAQDNAGKPAQAVSVYEKQALAGYDIYISGSTEMTMAIVDKVDDSQKPHFLIAFDAYMTGKGANRLRILPNYKLEGPMWVDYAKRRNAKKVFALTLNNPPIEEEFAKIVEPGLTALGVEFRRERFEWEGTDYRTLALKVKEYAPDLIMVNGYSVHLYPALSALRSQGLIKDGNTIAALDFIDLFYNDTPKSELADIAFMCPMFELSDSSAETLEWRSRFETRFKSRPSYVAAYSYDTGRMIARAHKNGTSGQISGLLAALPFDGVSGKIAVDSDRDLNSTLTIAKLSSEGKVVEVE